MIKFENTEVVGWEHAIRGMRNPMNSWEKSDSGWRHYSNLTHTNMGLFDYQQSIHDEFELGPNDLDLMKRLRNAGTDHRKFMRMITVYVDITAPLYWWKEFDTYKVGTVANSCSTMHKIHAKEFTLEDFSCEHLFDRYGDPSMNLNYGEKHPKDIISNLIWTLNHFRHWYLETKEQLKKLEISVVTMTDFDHTKSKIDILRERNKQYWWQMIQLLPSSYNQKRTVMLNYEVLANIYKSRRNHKLDEWAETKLTGDCPADMYPNKFTNGFCDWIKTLPYSELITGELKEDI